MIKPASLVSEFSLIYSGDPALDLPAEPEERARVLKLAQETGKWPLVEGQSPTVFHFKSITRTELGWLLGELQHSTQPAHDRRPLSPLEFDDLVFRLAIRSIDNFGTHSGKADRKRYRGDIYLASTDLTDAIHAACGELGASILAEFSAHLIERAQGGIRPL